MPPVHPHPVDKRLALPGTRKTWEPKRLYHNHHNIIRLIVLGLNNKEIAENCGVTPQLVSNIRNSELAQERINDLSERMDEKATDITAQIKAGAEKAVKLLHKAVDGEVEGLTPGKRIDVARDFLDRAGHSAVKRVDARHAHAIFSPEDIEAIKKRAIQVGLESGNIIDGECEELEEDDSGKG